ncbi:BTAD domain-containing putative transcriptional regulator [Nocardiopsis ganjiahuensis]|uniref:BTAD domain-containing putative transcriptional regulator n=1 Tax=Nocardiopsis ganjiahuensis TaxID=239984 RepID=UPI0004762AE3|nr:BTAD domain-containing putative transcriptional regulator [Nocardiopsis ganjiahuensis]
MRFGVLGPLSVRTDHGEPVPIPDTKVRALLLRLLLARGRPVPVDQLVDHLWGETPPSRPTAVLQARISQLRGALDAAEPGARALVRHRAPGYLLVADHLDAAQFEELVGRAAQDPAPRTRAELLTRALDLWREPAPAEFTDTASRSVPDGHGELTRWTQMRLTALEDLAETRLDLGEHSALAAELADPVARNPYRERLHAAYLRALHGAGRHAEALVAYTRLRSRLAEELGADPGQQLLDLHQAMLARDPALDPVPDPAPAPGRLPEPVDTLVGRDRPLRDLADLLAEHRLVTLTGPGGVGKTRLALAAGAALTRRAEAGDGAWLVELGGLAPDGDPVPLLAATLGVRDGSAREEPEELVRIVAMLRGRSALLVLDNHEHVVAPTAALVSHLLGALPRLRVLATGRVPLDIAGEHLYAVPPLDLPAPGTTDPDELSASGAVRLFTARARAARTAFVLDAATAPAVATICRRLDGIPLALELAATRLRHLGADEIAARLDDRFALLGTGRRDAPERQRTLRAVINWSWDQLDPAERAVLSRLAVTADGCEPDTAEALCSGPGPSAETGTAEQVHVPANTVLDVVGALADHSLVTVETASSHTRYRLLESVAAYALEHLAASGDRTRVRARHARHLADLAAGADAHLRGPDQHRWLERLDRESANLTSALDHAVAADDPDLALRLAVAPCWHRYLRGRSGQARAALDRALALPGPDTSARAEAALWRTALAVPATEDEQSRRARVPEHLEQVSDPVTRARLLWLIEHLRWGLGDQDRAAGLVRSAHEAAAAAGDRWGTEVSRVTLAYAALRRGDIAEALDAARQAEKALREIGDNWGALQATDALAQALESLGDLDGVADHHERALRLAEELRLWGNATLALSGLGRVALLRGDLDRADVLHARAAALAAEHSDAGAEQFAEAGTVLSARRRGDLDRAERLLRRWVDWNLRADSHIGTAFLLTQLGYVAEQRGDAEAALDLHARARTEAWASGDPRAVAAALERLAGAHALAGAGETAAALLAEATRVRERTGAPLTAPERFDVDRALARLAR